MPEDDKKEDKDNKAAEATKAEEIKKEDKKDSEKKSDSSDNKVAVVEEKEESKVTKVAEAGKDKKKPLTKVDIKNMSKLQAQKIINERDPDLLQKIEEEVAAKAKVIKRKVMIAGAVIIVLAVGYIVYNEMQKNKRSSLHQEVEYVSTSSLTITSE